LIVKLFLPKMIGSYINIMSTLIKYARFVFGLLLIFHFTNIHAQKATIIKFGRVESLLQAKTDSLQIINFWATWCAPCVKEMPLFEALQQAHPSWKITFISLDFADKVDQVNAFIKRKQIKSTVLLLDEIDYNSWIDKVDKQWSGAIPATLIINPITGKRKFVEKELMEGDLETLIEEIN
jgi:thiol-disulfide isomerase/thioredoxin